MVQSFFDTIVSILLFIPYILSFSADPNYSCQLTNGLILPEKKSKTPFGLRPSAISSFSL